MSELATLLKFKSLQYAELGFGYENDERLTNEELDLIGEECDQQMLSDDGENGKVEITVRQFALLVYGAGGGDCWKR